MKNRQSEIHLGRIIIDQIHKEGHSVGSIAKKINMDKSALYKMLKSPHINTYRIIQINQHLKCNLFFVIAIAVEQSHNNCAKQQ
jgi:lambda repressor-like predicted transcriptional regulator